MANVAAQLGNLLSVTADYNYYVNQQIYWSNLYEANSEKLQKQQSYYEDWEKAVDDALTVEKKCVAGGHTYYDNEHCASSRAEAEIYANAKIPDYDEAYSLELAELDTEYDTQKTLYEALVTLLQAEKDADKQQTATAAQDNPMLQS